MTIKDRIYEILDDFERRMDAACDAVRERIDKEVANTATDHAPDILKPDASEIIAVLSIHFWADEKTVTAWLEEYF